MNTETQQVYDTAQAAAILGVSAAVLRDMARKQAVPAVKVGRRLKFPRLALEAFVQSLNDVALGRVNDSTEDTCS